MDIINVIKNLLVTISPLIIIGLIPLVCSFMIKKNRVEKINKSPKGTIVQVRPIIKRNHKGYLMCSKYILSICFYYNGVQLIKEFTSFYEYRVNDVVSMELINDNIVSVLSEPSKEAMDNVAEFSVKIDQVLRWIGIGILLIAGGMFGVNLMDKICGNNIYIDFISSVGLFVILCLFFNNKRQKYQRKIKSISNGECNAIVGQIVDIKINTNYEQRRHRNRNIYVERESFYPIVEYQDGFDIKRKVIHYPLESDLNKIGATYILYKNRTTGEILSEGAIYSLKLKETGLKCVIIILLIIIAYYALSYLGKF